MTDRIVTIAQPAVRLDDPHLTLDNRARLGIRWAVYEALVTRQADGSFGPALAASWSLDDDAKSWRFEVRTGVGFHDGSPLRASDVVASLERVRDGKRAGELGTSGVIEGYLAGARIGVGRDGAVEIVTPKPFSDLLDLLVDIPIIPARMADRGVVDPIGTGPYRVAGFSAGQIEGTRFEGYWGERPTHKGVRWVLEADAATRADMLLGGAADLVMDPSNGDRGRLAQGDKVKIVDAASTTALAFLLNLNTKDGICTNRNVRRALNIAIDVEALIRGVGEDGARPLNGPLPEMHFAHDPATKRFRHDPLQARMMLAEEGLGSGFLLTIDVPTSLPDEAPVLGAMVARQLADVGGEVTVREHRDRAAYADMVRAKKIDDACCFDSSPISSFRVLREKLHGGVRGPWWQGYKNGEFDQLLDLAADTPDPVARQAIYRRAYRMVRDDAPWLFLYNPRDSWAATTDVAWQPSVSGVIQLR